ncbi:MAG: ribonuclease H-like domain-containing protein [Lachnospiraceae bacterium]|nr:ribonuclease H-like domain-containing protein [Lachnospiraceae bacterium]
MQCIKKIISLPESTYRLTDLDELSELLFFDIETTGFSAKSSNLYLIGLLFWENGQMTAVQLFAETPGDEAALLDEFIRICGSYRTLIHYNGNTFDIPYIKEKCKQLQKEQPFDALNGVDLYKRIAAFKGILHLENCKQKTVEQFVGITREDKYNGGELIKIYQDYVKSPSDEAKELLLLHNLEDILGMYRILPILSYMDMLLVPFRVVKVQANGYYDINGEPQSEIVMKIRFHSSFPQPVSINKFGCRFSGEGSEGFLKIPLFRGVLKYFYANYKDYYYLPGEDVALHKSVASFVDKDSREQATARTCYSKREGSYLPQWDTIFTPVFQRDYDDDALYFELTDEMKKQPELFRQYALHVLDMLIHAKEV